MRKYHSVKRAKYLKEVLRLYYEEGYGVREIAGIFPIGRTTVSGWIRTFAVENNNTLDVMKLKSPKEQSAKPSPEESPEALKQRIKELEKRLSNAEFRAEAYKTMIEVAESMGMPVRKKAGIKQ